jgi:hypothetical protein
MEKRKKLIVEEVKPNNITLKANPTTGVRIINYELREGNIEIYNVMGQKLFYPFNSPEGRKLPSFGGAGGGEIVIDVSHLANGMYFLKIQTGSGMVVKKFVKE